MVYGGSVATTPDAFQPAQPSTSSCFFQRLDAAFSKLTYGTYIGSSQDGGYGPPPGSLDSGGNVYLSWITYSPDFPTTQGAYHRAYLGPTASFMKFGYAPGLRFASIVSSPPGSSFTLSVSGLLADLKREYRDALRLVDLEDGKLSDLAEQSGITVENAAVRVHRPRKALRRKVEARSMDASIATVRRQAARTAPRPRPK